MKIFWKKLGVLFVILFVLGTNLFLGIPRLSTFSSVDEPYWTYGRTSKFWDSIKAHKWKSTSVNDKPGITVAILSGIGLASFDPMPYKSLRGNIKTDEQLSDVHAINYAFRLPIFLFCTLLLPLFYLFLRKLFDETTALIAFIFIGLSPITFGISLIINPDSLLWIFLPLSVLSYLVFQKNAEKKYLFASGILLGLALLTKYVANILYIFFFFLPFLEYMFAKEKPTLTPYLKKSFFQYLVIVALSMITFFILYPATWVNPNTLLKGTFLSKAFETTWPIFAGLFSFIVIDIFLFKNKITFTLLHFFGTYKTILMKFLVGLFLLISLFVIVNTFTDMKVLDHMATLASPKGEGKGSVFLIYADRLTADTFSLIYGISPIALLGLFSGLLLVFRRKMVDTYEAKIVFYFTSFILFYYLASTVNHVVATVRYQITLYPFALIISAIGLSYILTHEKIQRYIPKYVTYLTIFLLSLWSLLAVRPFYFAYTSALLPEQYFINLKDMGDGSYEAAEYLNNLPNPEKLTVWSDKGAVCAVFKGRCIIGFTNKRIKGVPFDYVVVSSGRKSRSMKMSGSAHDIINFTKAYETEDTVYKVTIDGRPNNYVKIVDMDNLRPEGKK